MANKINSGFKLALYPTAVTVIGADVIGKCRKMHDWHDKTADL